MAHANFGIVFNQLTIHFLHGESLIAYHVIPMLLHLVNTVSLLHDVLHNPRTVATNISSHHILSFEVVHMDPLDLHIIILPAYIPHALQQGHNIPNFKIYHIKTTSVDRDASLFPSYRTLPTDPRLTSPNERSANVINLLDNHLRYWEALHLILSYGMRYAFDKLDPTNNTKQL